MPHILISGCDMTRQIQLISIDCKVQFKDGVNYTHTRIAEIQDKIEQVLKGYFDNFESEIMTDKEHEQMINNGQ